MNFFENVMSFISSIVWGPYMLVFLVGSGVYLTFGLQWKTVTKLGYALKMLFLSL